MTLTELKIDLTSLNSADKAAAIEILLQTLSTGAIGIKKTPGVCGGDACVGNTRIICDKLRKSANCQGGRQKNVK